MRFKQYMLEEGDMVDAIKHGMSTGIKAFREKRKNQRQITKEKSLSNKILTAEGDELKKLVRQIVDNGYTIRDGKVQEPSRIKHMNKEVLECIRTKMASV